MSIGRFSRERRKEVLSLQARPVRRADQDIFHVALKWLFRVTSVVLVSRILLWFVVTARALDAHFSKIWMNLFLIFPVGLYFYFLNVFCPELLNWA